MNFEWSSKALTKDNGDHPDHSIFEIGKNIQKISGDLIRFALSQIPMKQQPAKTMEHDRNGDTNSNCCA